VKRILLILALACLTIQPAFAIEVAGVKLPDSVTIGGEQLLLNGYGIRKKFFFKVYLGSLYTATKASSTSHVLENTGGKLIRLNFLYSKLEKARMVGGFAKGIEANSPELLSDPGVKEFLVWFDTDFVEGDQIDFEITTDNLVTARHNKRQLGMVKSTNLAKAILLIYLGREPIDADMKAGMLGDL
jgi:hypothetical protein